MTTNVFKTSSSKSSTLAMLIAHQDAIANTLESMNKLMLCAIGTVQRTNLKILAINLVNQSGFTKGTKATFIQLAETSALLGEACHS